jgi:hypothetical protein
MSMSESERSELINVLNEVLPKIKLNETIDKINHQLYVFLFFIYYND